VGVVKDGRILVVDDEPMVRQSLGQFLGDEGYTVEEAADGADALARVVEHRPDVILLDLMMPVMDGWEFRRQQQADPALAPVPVIVLSALDQARASNLEATAFLKKPLDFDRLLSLVRTYCHSS